MNESTTEAALAFITCGRCDHVFEHPAPVSVDGKIHILMPICPVCHPPEGTVEVQWEVKP